MLSRISCGLEAGAVLRGWGVTGDVLEGPPGATGQSTYRLPTQDLGVWVVVEVSGDTRIDAMRVAAEEGRRVTIDERCSVGEEIREGLEGFERAEDALTDERLRELLADASAEAGLVVYVWSPHMPLSVDGYAEIEGAANALGLRLVPALFSSSDRDFAAREARRVGIPREGLREVASLELLMRDAQVHAPSVLAFAGGRVSAVLPGYRDRSGYVRFLEPFFDEARD